MTIDGEKVNASDEAMEALIAAEQDRDALNVALTREGQAHLAVIEERDAALAEVAALRKDNEWLGNRLDDEQDRAEREIKQARERFHHEHVYIMAQLEHYQKVVTDWAARQPTPITILMNGIPPTPPKKEAR
jgi:hypothetical protein